MTFEELKKQNNEKAIRAPRHNRHDEDALQMDCVSWFRDSFPKLATLLFHPNNEAFFGNGKTREQQARAGKRAKDMGVVPGVADLILLYPSGNMHGLCMELKTKQGRQRDTQSEWQNVVEANGYRYEIIRTREQFRKVVAEYVGEEPKDPDLIAAQKLFGREIKLRCVKK